ncbi:TRAP transporter large permease [Lacicoccus alkaliphilus]|uniref:C4-dicarboxylate transporter, DctM subunit n=1 Tax=Lacicoccus alkaliphilus DSM 16010 TaxID=1123231 RepID=A0A1M7CYN0_9BACL|nr:TRAP transporter large permease [Salinicoccus alkaliphilus]SHL72285.1 C4-dicarboxylate transporter, DctM subunit [Salinicoccus alkaliphilus DSM 16010]
MTTLLIIVILVFLVALILNIPIAFTLVFAGFAVLIYSGGVPLSFFIQTSFGASDSFPLLAIPFFILAGEIMSTGGIAKRLIDFVRSLVGSLTGGIGMITIITSFIFAAISGSGAATVAAIGGIMIPYMVKYGYPKPYAATLSANAGALGPIIPPSIVFIIYGVMAGVSIGDLFIAGIIPGMLLAVFLLIINYVYNKKEKFEENFKPLKEEIKTTEEDVEVVVENVEVADENVDVVVEKRSFWSSLNEAKYALLAPIIILGGIYGGIVTPTEAAVIAVVYSLLVSVVIYRELSLTQLSEVFMRASLTSGIIMIFVGTASFFGRMLALDQVPLALANSLASVTTNTIIIMLLINVFLLLVGMFMETVAAILLFVPLLLPIVIPLGVDPVHFGIIVCVNLALGLVTPPFGLNLFIASDIADISFERTFKYFIPFFSVLLLALLLITFIPQLSLFLPNLMAD